MNSGPSADQSGNSFVGDHNNGGGIFNNANEAHETLRNRLDGSQWERVQRSRDLRSRPQPLTGDERQVLRETVAPLLRDLVATGMSLPDIREEAHADSGVEAVHAWIKDSDRAGTSIQIWMSVPPVARVVMLAEQIQEWAGDRLHDAGRPAAWPGCPEHPSVLHHRLSPEVREGSPAWTCPESGHLICAIGSLPG